MFCYGCGTPLENVVVSPGSAGGNDKEIPPGAEPVVVAPGSAGGDDKSTPKRRSRPRPRQCKVCANKARLEARRANPVLWLKHRFYNSARKMWPGADHLWSEETIRSVYERCEGKSVESGNADISQLCVFSKKRERDQVPTVDDLVLLTTTEAHSNTAKKRRIRRKKKKDAEVPVD